MAKLEYIHKIEAYVGEFDKTLYLALVILKINRCCNIDFTSSLKHRR